MPLYCIIPERDPLQNPLMFLQGGALIPLCKVAILDAFWGDPGPLFDPSRKPVERYFEYFESQCRLTLHAWEKYDLSELKFRHVTEVARMLKSGARRDEIEGFLNATLIGDCRIIAGEIIDLTVKLLLMVPIWSFWQGDAHAALTWVEGTLPGSFARQFKAHARSKLEDNLQNRIKKPLSIEKSFTAKNIEEIGGMRIVWTSNLLDHLKIRAEDNTVSIFHHAAFLHYQKNNQLYPPGLVEETLRTIAILLPSKDTSTKNWFLQQHLAQHLDTEAIHCSSLTRDGRNIEKFNFWKERLQRLVAAYDHAKPLQPKSLLRRCLSQIHLQ